MYKPLLIREKISLELLFLLYYNSRRYETSRNMTTLQIPKRTITVRTSPHRGTSFEKLSVPNFSSVPVNQGRLGANSTAKFKLQMVHYAQENGNRTAARWIQIKDGLKNLQICRRKEPKFPEPQVPSLGLFS